MRAGVTTAKRPESAFARIYVDTGYELFINGRFVARVDEWANTRDYDVKFFIKQGYNQIAVHALNHSGHRGFAFELVFDGQTVLVSDKNWKTCTQERWGWILENFDDSSWDNPHELDLSAAGEPQWWTLPGSQPELIVPTLDCTQFFGGAIPKACDSPFFNAKPVNYTPDKNVVDLIGKEYETHTQTPHLPEIHKFSRILECTADEKDGVVSFDKTERYTGASFIIDFGIETLGFFRMRIKSEKPVSFRLYYAETYDQALTEVTRDMAQHRMLVEEYRLFGGEQEFETHTRLAFRFARVEFFDCAAPVKADGFSVRTALYPVARKGYFACNNADLNKLWQMGERTMHYCMQEYYLDAPKRDRLFWVGDACVEAMINYYTFADTDLFEFSWDEAAKKQYPDGGIPSVLGVASSIIWDYVAWYVIGYYDYYMYTGKSEFALNHLESMLKATDWLINRADETGLINVPANPLGKLWMVTLPHVEGYDPFINILYCKSLETAAIFTKMAGDGRYEKYSKLYETTSEALKLRHPEKEMFELYEATWDSPVQYVLGGIEIAQGNPGKMLSRINTYWKHMLDAHMDCLHEGTLKDFREYFSSPIDEKSEPDKRVVSFCSFCHAWTASPNVWLPTGIAGIKPIEPGFKKVQIKPVTDALKNFKCVVPTPYGEIAVACENGVFSYYLPDGITAELTIGGKITEVTGKGQVSI